MKRSNGRTAGERRAAYLFFLTGVAFVLLTAFGPVVFGPEFKGEILLTPGWALMGVGASVLVGISLATIDWSGLLARVIVLLLENQKKGDSE